MYSRLLDDGSPAGRLLTFAASGWTWQQIFVLQDLETGSLWFPGLKFDGGLSKFLVCVSGELQDAELPAVDSFRGIWKTWFREHPNTKFMFAK